MITEGSELWQYLSPNQRVLAEDGEYLVADCRNHENPEPTDYSYLVFPYAKMYEGFLKQLFRDLGIISDRDYDSVHYRIGKSLSPNMTQKLGNRSAYRQVERQFGKGLATRLWHTWTEGRNLVFHYFPHNYRALSHQQAEMIIREIIGTMEEAVDRTHILSLRKSRDIRHVGSFHAGG